MDILKVINQKINKETINLFNINRNEAFTCCVRAMNRKSFKPENRISVLFTDEEAIDDGGPSREFWRLLLIHLKNSNLFSGTEESKNVSLNNNALNDNLYFEAGRIIALSLIQGGPGPGFFSSYLFNYLIDPIKTKGDIQDITDDEIRKSIESIMNSTTLEEIQNIVSDSLYLQVAGIHYIENFEKKDTIVEG